MRATRRVHVAAALRTPLARHVPIDAVDMLMDPQVLHLDARLERLGRWHVVIRWQDRRATDAAARVFCKWWAIGPGCDPADAAAATCPPQQLSAPCRASQQRSVRHTGAGQMRPQPHATPHAEY